MNYNIKQENIKALFSEIFAKWPNCSISETYSEFDKKLEKGLTINALIKKVKKLQKQTLMLSFYLSSMKGKLIFHTIKINPSKIRGAGVRYTLRGWGLVSIYIKKKQDHLEIYCSANSEKRAKKWFPTYPEMKNPAIWNWEAVENTRKSLNGIIKKYSI